MSLENKLGALLGDFSKLAPRIKHIEVDSGVCGERIEVRCSYISFRDGHPTFDEFIDTLAEHIIPFCLPRSEIRVAQKTLLDGDHVGAGRIMMRLSERARSLFIRAKKGSHRSGEAGEIVLYILSEWLLHAPQIVSKMFLKTNAQMPVHGTDGIHARYDGKSKKLYLYWGESKAHAQMADALSSALSSVKEFLDNRHDLREIDIVSTHSDFDGFDEESKEAFLRYLDPYSEESNERVVVHSCLLVFEHASPKGASPDKAEKLFVDEVKELASSFAASIKQKAKNKGLEPQRFEFFLLPISSVQDFRDKFQKKIGWPE